jgi:hypothetical protein
MEALEPPANALGDLCDGVSSTAPLAELDLTRQQTALVREALDSMVRERSGGSGPAVLTAPSNIGIGTK